MKENYRLIVLVTVILSACSNSPDKIIQKRWKAVGVEGSEKKKERFANNYARHSTELEFKDGKINAYLDGVIQGSADYTMASDGKSLVAMENGNKITLKIISLDGENMHAILDGFMSDRDTIIFAVTGSTREKEIEKETTNNREASAWETVKKEWHNVQIEYQRRADLVGNLLDVMKKEQSFGEEALNNIALSKTKATNLNLNADDLTPKKIAEFQDAQNQLSQSLEIIETNQLLKRSANYKDLIVQLESLTNKIRVSQRGFNMAVADFNEIAAANGNKPKELEFKDDAKKIPNVKF